MKALIAIGVAALLLTTGTAFAFQLPGSPTTATISNTYTTGEVVTITATTSTWHAGYLILLEAGSHSFADQDNWSDVIVFSNGTAKPVGDEAVNKATLISDPFTQADKLSTALGFTLTYTDIVSGNAQYRVENVAGPTTYAATSGSFTGTWIVDEGFEAPGIGTTGMVLLFVLLAGTGLVLVWRRRMAGSEA